MSIRANGRRPQGLIVGDGPLRERAAPAPARELGLADDVRFTGTVSDVRPLLAAMDVFVLPSWAEGMSNALMEAMAAGRPVVATEVGGNSEVVGGRPDSGCWCRRATRIAIADAVGGLLDDPRAGRRRLGAGGGAEFVTDRFGAARARGGAGTSYEERLALRTRRAGVSAGNGQRKRSERRRVLVVGLDAATWRSRAPVGRGRRPADASARSIREGVRAPLRSTLPALTPPGWTSAATGRNPGKHNVFNFYRGRAGGLQPRR